MKVDEPEEKVESIAEMVLDAEEADCGEEEEEDVTTSSRPIRLTKTPLPGTGYEPIWIPRGFSRVCSEVR
jgi:hypothetical protein